MTTKDKATKLAIDELANGRSWLMTDSGDVMIYGTDEIIKKSEVDSLVVTKVDEAKQVELRNNISTFIYSKYTEKKQSQDRGYQAYAQTVIVGLSPQLGKPVTLDELTIDVMQAVIWFFDGKLTVDTYIADKPEPLKEHYAKLLKIGVRLRWTKACIDEGKAAMAENREPNYPALPNFEKGGVQS